MPQYNKYTDEKLGTVIEYIENDGSISKRRLIFPENTETNWRRVDVNVKKENGENETKTYYLYHTFYPFQLDINWENPQVLYYMLDTITKWANLGVDIFRMDAIPYLSKEEGTDAENEPKTHSIINILSNYLQITAPSSVIQVEACQNPKDIIPYFGKNRDVEIEIWDTQKDLNRTSEAQIAYNFPYMNAIWASLISEDKKYFTDTYKKTPNIPKNSVWGVFLRVHDELTLEMVSPEVRDLIFQDLQPKGAGFRNGFGVSGRLANFLDKNPDRIKLAFAIMLSTQGIPIIYYGDEVGVTNNFDNAKKSAQNRKNKNKFLKLLSVFDSRDINRGPVPRKLFYGSQKGWYLFNSKVYYNTKHLLRVRKSLPVMSDGGFDILKTSSNSCLAYIRKNKTQKVLVINNLAKDKVYTDITLPITMFLKNNKKITRLKNLLNGENIKVNVSLTDNTLHLLLHPYQVLWLDLSEGVNYGK
ncbi:alpha-glucosidase C-terminal domain-containing protein [bacterium]|nr:alpha-glucosidase C-terminal domain-containing protein [bacterium]